MKNIKKSYLINLFILITFLCVCIVSNVYAHKAKKHKKIVCILEKDRTKKQKANCKQWTYFHRLCKLDQDCAALLIEKYGEDIELLKQKLNKTIETVSNCGKLLFNHKVKKAAKIYKEPSTKSKVLKKVKKDDDLLFISPTDDKKWNFVKYRITDDSCADGYIKQNYVVSKEDGDEPEVAPPPKDQLITILDPTTWEIENKFMIIDAEGSLSIKGYIEEGKIDEIIINEEEEIINDDNTFTYLTFVSSEGVEIRIIGNKNGVKVKELSFKVKVGK